MEQEADQDPANENDWQIEPEDGLPAPEANDDAPIQVSDHPAGSIHRGDYAQWASPFARRIQVAYHGHTHWDHRAGSEGLDHAGADQNIERNEIDIRTPAGHQIVASQCQARRPGVGYSCQVGTKAKDHQGSQINFPSTVNIREPAHEGHRDAVSQKVAGHNPGSVVHSGLERDLQIDQYMGQDR